MIIKYKDSKGKIHNLRGNLFTGHFDKDGIELYAGDEIGCYDMIDGEEMLSTYKILHMDGDFVVDVSYSKNGSSFELLSEMMKSKMHKV